MKKIDLNDYVEKAVENYWNDFVPSDAIRYFNRATILEELAFAINPAFKDEDYSSFKTLMETFFEESEIEEAITGFYEILSDKVSLWLYDNLEEKE